MSTKNRRIDERAARKRVRDKRKKTQERNERILNPQPLLAHMHMIHISNPTGEDDVPQPHYARLDEL